MRFKNLFTVPDGQQVTDKHLRRVLLASICSILLCMTCLVSTTWAWFTVSIENTGNIIQIGEPKVSLQVDSIAFESGSKVEAGTHSVLITHAGEPDVFRQKSTLYVILTVDGTNSVYTVLNSENGYSEEIEIQAPDGQASSLSCEVSWFPPANAEFLE